MPPKTEKFDSGTLFVTSKPVEGIRNLWWWEEADLYYRLTSDLRFEKLTLSGWVPANELYLWRCWEDPSFREVQTDV